MLNQSIAEKSTCINLSTDRQTDGQTQPKADGEAKANLSCAKKDNSD